MSRSTWRASRGLRRHRETQARRARRGLPERRPRRTASGGHALASATGRHADVRAPGCRDVVITPTGSPGRWERAITSHPLLDGRWVLEQMPMHLALTEGFHSWHAHARHQHAGGGERRASTSISPVGTAGRPSGRASSNTVEDAPLRHYRDERGSRALLFDGPAASTARGRGLTDRGGGRLDGADHAGSGGPGLRILPRPRTARRRDSTTDRRADLLLRAAPLAAADGLHGRHGTGGRAGAVSVLSTTKWWTSATACRMRYGRPRRSSARILRRLAPACSPGFRTRRTSGYHIRIAAVRWVHALPGRTAHRLRRLGVASRARPPPSVRRLRAVPPHGSARVGRRPSLRPTHSGSGLLRPGCRPGPVGPASLRPRAVDDREDRLRSSRSNRSTGT